MEAQHLLPDNRTRFEEALSEALDPIPALMPEIEAVRGFRFMPYHRPWLGPWLVAEYGLGEIASFFVSTEELVSAGIAWQRLRGTPAAITVAFGWIGYDDIALLDRWPFRRMWHRYQIEMGALPGADEVKSLTSAEYLADLSDPARSVFFRGFHGYDVPALEPDQGMLDACHLDNASGIRLIGTTGALWSFGRTHEIEHFYSEAEGLALGNWIEEVEGESLAWELMDYPWETADFAWETSAAVARRILLATWFSGRAMHLVLRDGADAVIGYRRCRAARPVAVAGSDGAYVFDGGRYDPSPAGERLYVEAMTDFEDADAVTAASVALVVGGEVTGAPAGRLWLQPGQLSGGVEIAAHEVAVPLRRTVRDRFKIMMRF